MEAARVVRPEFAPALAFVAGFADATTFVGAGGVFCAHVTGNFVVLAADLARGAASEGVLKVATFPVFVAAVAAATWLHRRAGGAGSAKATRTLLWTSGVLIALAAVAGISAQAHESSPARTAVVVLLVLAMGAQNALHRVATGLGPATTVMTGNVTQWFVDLVARPKLPDVAKKRGELGAVIVAFTFGCAAGAYGVEYLGFASLALPALLVLVVARRV